MKLIVIKSIAFSDVNFATVIGVKCAYEVFKFKKLWGDIAPPTGPGDPSRIYLARPASRPLRPQCIDPFTADPVKALHFAILV